MLHNSVYETYDCILQYVNFPAYSHNFQTNNMFSLSTIYYVYYMST